MSLNKLPEVIVTEILNKEYFEYRKETLRLQEDAHYDYFILGAPPIAVMILAKTEKEEWVLNWEYRHPVRKILLSCPGGVKGQNESALQCAARELLEETGYEAENFKEIGEAFPFSGACNQKTIFVAAERARKVASPALEQAEFIEAVLLSYDQIKELFLQKIAIDSHLLAALFFMNLQNKIG